MTLLTKPNYNSLFPNWMEFDRWENFFQDPYHSSGAGLEQRPRNKYRWDETDESYKIDIVMPGLTKKDIDVTFNDDTLSIKCNKDVSENDQSFFGVKTEQSFKNFPSTINTGKITAEMGDGILTVVLPKKESDKPKTIEIR
jgi:HSP20 family protein